MIKKIACIAFLILAISIPLTAGCGGSDASENASSDPLSLLKQAGDAVSAASSYRIDGSMKMDSGASGSNPISIALDITGEVQQSGGTVSRHVVMSAGDKKQEYYIIGPDVYIYSSNNGWTHSSLQNYETQNAGMGMIDIQQLGLMAEMAQDAKVIEDDGNTITISFHLNEDFFKASLPTTGEGFSQEELDTMQQILSGTEADVQIRLFKDSMLVDKTQIDSTLSIPPYDDIHTSMVFNTLDYDKSVDITLPAEAKNAAEAGTS
jgi:Family of unknown function (DUF6612)